MAGPRYSDPSHHRGENRGICSSCDRDRQLYDVQSLDQMAWYCGDCIARFGAETLRRASDAALAVRQMPKQAARATCLRCGTGLVPGISVGLMCHQCNGAYKERFGKPVKWQ